MSLKEILEGLVQNNEPITLSDSNKEWNAGDLLQKLSPVMLKRKAHIQPGLYIAEVSDAGYLGSVLFKIKQI
ncbi:MAG: hypothetical protein KKA84_12245 [Bacteroidetes bacterium]|nr:hypothetical protein [Bacteroidota bacterium]